MHALIDFFSTDYGLMSAVVLAITVGMLFFYIRFFLQHIKQDTEAAAQREAQARGAATSH